MFRVCPGSPDNWALNWAPPVSYRVYRVLVLHLIARWTIRILHQCGELLHHAQLELVLFLVEAELVEELQRVKLRRVRRRVRSSGSLMLGSMSSMPRSSVSVLAVLGILSLPLRPPFPTPLATGVFVCAGLGTCVCFD